MKKIYVKMIAEPLEFEPEVAILAGSKTLTGIQVNDVTVEAYQQGFGTDLTNDFQDVSFD